MNTVKESLKESLKDYNNIIDNYESLFSIYIYNKTVNEVIDFFQEELEKAKKINNPIKKHKINNRLFNFIKYLENNYNENDTLNMIFLLDEKVINYTLNKTEIAIANEFNFPKIFVKCDNNFCIDYFIDLFYNLTFIYGIRINKNEYSLLKLNKNKSKTLESGKINNEEKLNEIIEKIRINENYKDIIVVVGSNYKKIVNKKVIIKYENNNIYDIYQNEVMKENNILLKKRLDELKNEKTNYDLFIFGKLKLEIKESIENYIVKELYIEEKKLEKLKTFIDEEYFNFTIIPIKSIEDGDIASIFIKDYNGLMAIKYF